MQVKFIFKVVHLASFWKWGFWNSEVACRPRCTWEVKKTWLTGDALPVFVYYIRGNDNNNKKENIYLVGFLKTLPPDGLFRSHSLFSAKNYFQSSHYKNQECNHFFFLFSSFLPPRSFFFSFPFPSLAWFWSWSRTKNLPFDAFSFKMTANFVKLVFKNRLDVHRANLVGDFGLNVLGTRWLILWSPDLLG